MRGILAHMEDSGVIGTWEHAENRDRHDYSITIGNEISIVEQKGCLDGNNINISERPPQATEFYIWGLCTNQGSDLAKGVWSAIMRVTADMVATGKQVDGLIIWDMLCGSSQRPCPKLINAPTIATEIGSLRLPPPCIYLLPQTIGNARSNPHPPIRNLDSLKFVPALLKTFKGTGADVNFVDYEVRMRGANTQRQVRVVRDDVVTRESRWTDIKRITG
jgi:hypothetical protein